jgi:hypothetical protein
MLIAILIDHDWVQAVRPEALDSDAARRLPRGEYPHSGASGGGQAHARACFSVTGAGVKIPARHFAFLRARRAGASSPEEYAQFAASEPQTAADR